MTWDEVEMRLLDDNDQEVAKKSFFNVSEKDPLNNLAIGEEVEIDWGQSIIKAVVTHSEWGDYNIRGFFCRYVLRTIARER